MGTTGRLMKLEAKVREILETIPFTRRGEGKLGDLLINTEEDPYAAPVYNIPLEQIDDSLGHVVAAISGEEAVRMPGGEWTITLTLTDRLLRSLRTLKEIDQQMSAAVDQWVGDHFHIDVRRGDGDTNWLIVVAGAILTDKGEVCCAVPMKRGEARWIDYERNGPMTRYEKILRMMQATRYDIQDDFPNLEAAQIAYDRKPGMWDPDREGVMERRRLARTVKGSVQSAMRSGRMGRTPEVEDQIMARLAKISDEEQEQERKAQEAQKEVGK